MNYPVPFIALCALGSKFLAKKYPHPLLASFILILAVFCSGLIFYAGFAHLVSSEVFYFLCWLPALSAFIAKGCTYFGYERVSIPLSMAIISSVTIPLFIPFGIFKTFQAVWSLCLMSSVVIAMNVNFINPFERSEKKKEHEFSI